MIKYADTIRFLLTEFSTGIYTVAAMSRLTFEKGIKTKSGKPKSSEAMKKILKNLFYAGYTKNKLSDKIIKGRHTPLVDEEIIYKNIEIINKNKKVIVITGDDLYSLRGTLLCTNCHQYRSASTPHGNGGHYQKYHCSRSTCTQKVTGRKVVSGDVDVIHKEFRELLEAKRPLNAGITRLYKNLVLRAWNDEYGEALKNARQINHDIELHKELRFSTNEKFIADKITDKDRDEQLKRIDEKIEILEQEKVEMDSYVKEKEQIVDDSMTFIKTPDIFWNQANTRSRQAIQKLLFPSGITYDFETGFGTTKQIDSYLLLEEISKNNDEKSALVAASGLEPLTPGL